MFVSEAVSLLFVLWHTIRLVDASCLVDGHTFRNGEHWLQDGNFNVTCRRGKISVVNCLTDSGTVIPVGSPPFVENGNRYTCDPTEEDTYTDFEYDPDGFDLEGSGQQNLAEVASECDRGQPEYTFSGFSVSCLTHQILGCVDAGGHLVEGGFFVLRNKLLKFCRVFSNGKRARIENRGCFNGSRNDDAADQTLHVPKYAIWEENRTHWRCGDNGIRIYKCPLKGDRTIHSGSAWIDEFNVLNVCH